jgi:hypothetical protein
MSGHLSTEEKALFKAEIDAEDYAFFIESFRGKQNKVQKNRGTIVLDGMVVYEDLQVSFGSPKTYQYNLETQKRKVSSNTVLSIKLSL